ncbi:stage II sporulation protein D [Paenibacillus caui]|uniref:stage II sporulation protein D n=1 Tax=Paenibacillus caui TaxID=2873927 RepID=UPI001EFFBB36|nr:stage II sporulation protein D [Paenibacillus caui]
MKDKMTSWKIRLTAGDDNGTRDSLEKSKQAAGGKLIHEQEDGKTLLEAAGHTEVFTRLRIKPKRGAKACGEEASVQPEPFMPKAQAQAIWKPAKPQGRPGKALLGWIGGSRRPPRWGGARRRSHLRLPVAAAVLAALAVLLPALLVHRGGSDAPPQPEPAPHGQAPARGGPSASSQADGAARVSVYLTDTRAVETLPIEQYVLGVVAAEMHADFGLEALKAQAIAARTFIVKRLVSGDRSGVPGGRADVTDTVSHQAYLSEAELASWKRAGKARELEKLQRAVDETDGMIMTYQGKPITALFFSASGEFTENSEDYWDEKIPYLRSVASPWDARIDPVYKETVSLPLSEVFTKLGISSPSLHVAAGAGTVPAYSQTNGPFKILSRTKGDSIKEISIGGQTFSGREIREKLELRSSRFEIQVKDGEAVITTYGYGHGVGMSQWGATGMAREGYTVQQILRHYYTGISFEQASKFLKQKF